MAERLPTPVHQETGLPYCFAPNPNLPPPILYGAKNLELLADWNHQFPKFAVRVHGAEHFDNLGQQALEGSRVQWVDYREHHNVYNPRFTDPELPDSCAGLARTVIFASSGFIPPLAIDLTGSEPREIELSDGQRRELWETQQVRVYNQLKVREFLLDYVLGQDVDHIREGEIEEFLTTMNWPRRIYLGHCLAAKLVERSVEPIEQIYTELRKDGMMPEMSPTHPRDLVKSNITRNNRSFGPVFSALHKKLGPYNPRRKRKELEYQQILAALEEVA